MKIYIAAPLFNEMEKERNKVVDTFLKNLGHATYLPQEDGGTASDLIAQGNDSQNIRMSLFKRDVEEIRTCDVMLALLDGRVPDEGMCVEIGMAHAWGKTIIGYKTDTRTFDMHGNNLMLDGCITMSASSLDNLEKLLLEKSTASV